MSDYNITTIEALTETQAKEMATESMKIKDHDIYFVDFGGGFGFSALVFNNNHHIHYANDYELHHSGRTKDELKSWYIEALNNKLFTDAELEAPIKDYDDYNRKGHYLHNYYGMRYDNVSAFHISTPENDKQFEKDIKGLTYNPVSFSYMKDVKAIEHMKDLFKALLKRYEERKTSYDYMKDAFKHEMFNHEYAINSYQRNWDVLSCFYNVEYVESDSYEEYFNQLNLDEMTRKAYRDARREYYKYCEEHDMF